MASAPAHQITPWRHNHAGAVTLSFDDGLSSQIANAVPLLNARGQKGTFFITTTGMDATWAEWRQVAAQGHEIASHTVNHYELTTLSDSALRFELSESQRVINQNIPSQSCVTIAYPLNTTDARVQAVTSEYYIAARGGYVLEDGGDFNFYEDIPEFDPPPGMSPGSFKAINFNNVASDNGLYDVPTSSLDLKLDVTATYHAWYNTYLHFIPDDTTLLAAFLDHVAARDLWMATFGDVAKYMRERKASTLSVLSSNSTAIQLRLTNALNGAVYNAPLTIRSVVPSTWLIVHVAQGTTSVVVNSVVEGGDRVVYFDAVPNQGTITLSSEPPTLTSISVAPASASVVAGGTQQFTATGKDQSGSNLIPQPVFTWTVSGGGTVDASGLFTAEGTAGGPFTVTATSGSVSGTASVTVTAPPVLTTISVSPSPASVGVGGTLQFSAIARDQYGNALAPQPSITWTVSGGGTISSGGLFTAGSAPGGPFTVTATSGSVSGSASVMVTQTLTSMSVSPASVGVSAGGAQQFAATAMDQLGNPLVSQPGVSWTVSGGGTISSGGLFTAGSAPGGPFTVTATSGSVSGSANVMVTQTLTSISVSPASVSVSAGGAQQFAATAMDQLGNPLVSQPGVGWTVSGGGTIDTNGLFAAGTTAGGPFTVTATNGSVSGSASVTVTNPPTLTSISVSPASASVGVGGARQFSALAMDQYGHALDPQPGFTWTVSGGGTIDTSGLFTAGSAPGGPFIVTATSGSVSGSAEVTVTQTLTSIAVSPASAGVAAGGAQQFAATAMDELGHPLVSQPGFTWTVSGGGTIDGDGLFTAGAAPGGPFTVTATSGGVSGSANVTVTQTLTSIGITPSTASVAGGGTQQFAATAMDQLGHPLVSQPDFSWTVNGGGTIDANGLFTGGSVPGGPFTVTASSGSVSGTASVTVTQMLASISVTPSPASVAGGGTQQFTATAEDQFGNPLVPQPSFSWAADGGGTIDASGLFTAETAAGGPFTVTASSGGVSGTASVTVTVPLILASISIFPSLASVPADGTQQFAAMAMDQFGNALVPQPNFSWTVSGGGTISGGGLFTAGSAPDGPFAVTAASGNLSDVASVTVTAPQGSAGLSIQTYAGLTVTGAVGTVYSIEYVTDLAQSNTPSAWRCLEYLQLPASPFLWADKSAAAGGKRFYRALAMPPPAAMVFIPSGKFRMGSPTSEKDRTPNEGPQTAVTISRGIWMGKYEVTQGEYAALMGGNPSHFTGDSTRPVESVTWSDATNYCARLTQQERAAGRITANSLYRLPTEAEWEYACRAWTSTRFSHGDDVGYTNLANFAWYYDNCGGTTKPVGGKLPNAWGLYDMHGNVWEWCQDWWSASLPGGAASDPQGPTSGVYRVVRGGNWYDDPEACRSAKRFHYNSSTWDNGHIGFRVVLAAGQP